MTDPRLHRILDAASRLFILTRYPQTQISHIAKAANISVGAVYTLFTSKRAILDFVLKCTIEPTYIESNLELPITEAQFNHLEADVNEAFKQINEAFSNHLTDDDYCYADMLSDAFDVASHYAVGCLVLEKNPEECPAITEQYLQYRLKFHETILAYISRFMEAGTVRKLPYPVESSKFIVEALAWWAMHIRYDAFEKPEDISPEQAKTICLDALLNAFSV